MSLFCFHCERVFSTQGSLNRHTREVHNILEPNVIQYEQSIAPFKCLEGCEVSFKRSMDLRHHLGTKHDYNNRFKAKEITFVSYEEFYAWLDIEKKSENVDFVKRRGSLRCEDGAGQNVEKIYFDCIRSGTQSIKKCDRKRMLKIQGSAKINLTCLSQIIITRNIDTNQCNIVYYPDHYGHEHEIKYLRLSDVCRKGIATKLMTGVSATRILDEVRDNIPLNIGRDDLITRQDILNIKASFNISIQEGIRHKDDGVSVDLWVEEVRSSASTLNPVLLYKKQNEISNDYNLENNDFCLIIMNENQKNILKKFGHNIVCIDETHGMNSYDFGLSTLLVIDEFGQGFPVAFLYSNRKDTYIYEVFFQCILNCIGNKVTAKVFMSDITNVYYNAWEKIMGSSEFKLFCSWHVDRAWQQNLQKVKDSEKRKWVYKTLKYLQTNLDSEIFEKEFEQFLNLLASDESTKDMYTYLNTFYVNNRKQWAYSYRKLCNINTNMHIESMHKTLKYVYLEGKKVKRLDKSIHALQKYVRDKSIDRIIKLMKGKLTDHINLIHSRHRIALTIHCNIENDENNVYRIVHEDREYYITKKSENSCCELKCKFCHICIHMYECTCLDFCIKTIICKHIHYLCFHTTHTSISEVEKGDAHLGQAEINGLAQNIHKSRHLTNEPDLKAAIETSALQIIANTKTLKFSHDQHVFMLKNLKVLLAMKPSEGADANKLLHREITNSPPNKKIKKQTLFSTKKKVGRKNVFNKKPDGDEIQIIKETLSESLFTSTDEKHDHSYA